MLETPEQIAQYALTSTGKAHIVSLVDRPGVASFIASIEYRWFPPCTPENELFEVRILFWEELPWIIASIPTRRMRVIRDLANGLHLKVVKGAPVMMPWHAADTPQKSECHYFPGGWHSDGKRNENMYCVESQPSNPLHKQELEVKLNRALVIEREKEVLQAFAAGFDLSADDIFKFIYGYESRPEWRHRLQNQG